MRFFSFLLQRWCIICTLNRVIVWWLFQGSVSTPGEKTTTKKNKTTATTRTATTGRGVLVIAQGERNVWNGECREQRTSIIDFPFSFLAVLIVRNIVSKQIPFFILQYYFSQFWCHLWTLCTLSFHLVDHSHRGNRRRGRGLSSRSYFALFSSTNTVKVSSTLSSDFYGWSSWLFVALCLTSQCIPMLCSPAKAGIPRNRF